MFTPVRVARRSLASFVRPLSTVSSSNPLSAINRSASGPPSIPTPSSTIRPTAPLATPSGLPLMLDIPPAEDPLLQYLTNSILKHGNRKRASRIVSRMLLWVHTFTRAPPLEIVREAVKTVSPSVRCMTHRHGAKNVSKPIALSEKQRTRFGVQWILEASTAKSGQTLEERLAREIVAVIQGSSKAVDKKKAVHHFAMVNRGNAETRV